MDQAGASRQGLAPNLVVAKAGVQAQVAHTCCTSEQREGGHLLTGERFHRVQERRPHAPALLVRSDSQSTDVPDARLVACPDGPDDASGGDGFGAGLWIKFGLQIFQRLRQWGQEGVAVQLRFTHVRRTLQSQQFAGICSRGKLNGESAGYPRSRLDGVSQVAHGAARRCQVITRHTDARQVIEVRPEPVISLGATLALGRPRHHGQRGRHPQNPHRPRRPELAHGRQHRCPRSRARSPRHGDHPE